VLDGADHLTVCGGEVRRALQGLGAKAVQISRRVVMARARA